MTTSLLMLLNLFFFKHLTHTRSWKMSPMLLKMLTMEVFQKKREKDLQPQQDALPKYQ